MPVRPFFCLLCLQFVVGGPPAWGTDPVTLKLSGGLTVMRAWTTSYFAETDPPGTPCEGFSWTFSWGSGANTYSDADSDGDGKSIWSGKMVVNGIISCTAVVQGVPVSAQTPVTVTPRPWYTPITCIEDNEPGWGGLPTEYAILGMYRDRDSDLVDIFVPRTSTYNWDSAYYVGMISSGPCSGWWYVTSSSLKCQRETVINRYLKGDGPTLGGYNFAEINSLYQCFTSGPGDFVQAVMNHEYRGTPPSAKSPEGHFGRTEQCVLDFNHDAKKHIEVLAARSASSLRMAVNDTIFIDEQAVEDYAGDEDYMWTYGPNWGVDFESLGLGHSSRWHPDSSSWTGCFNPPSDF